MSTYALEPEYDQQLEVPTLEIHKCPNCGSDEAMFLDISRSSGRFYYKCLVCSWIFTEK